jgi:hypothetical protein
MFGTRAVPFFEKHALSTIEGKGTGEIFTIRNLLGRS